MSFADELRKKSNEQELTKCRSEKMEQIVHPVIQDCIIGVKQLCISEAKKGKPGISGFLGIGYEEYATTPTVTVSERRLEPWKNRSGFWLYTPGYSFDFGIDCPVFDTPNEDRLKMATIVKDGILKGLYECGFSHLHAEVVIRPHYQKVFSSFLGKEKFSKSTNKIHFIHLSISWK